MKLQAKPFNIVFIQVYAPTSDYTDDQVEEFYENIKKATEQVKGTDVVIFLGDWKARLQANAMVVLLESMV